MSRTLKTFIIADIILAIILGFVWTNITFADTTVTGYFVGNVYRSGEATYLGSRYNAVGATVDTTTYVYIGQGFNGSLYQNNRTFMSFDIPAFNGDSLATARFYINGEGDVSATDFDVYILSAPNSGEPLTTGDFDNFDGYQAGGAYNGEILNDTWNSVSYSANWNIITGNDACIDSINAHEEGTFKIVMVSKEDYTSSEPTANEQIRIDDDPAPYLLLTFIGDDSNRRNVLYSKTPQVLYDKTRIPIWKP